MCYLYTIMIVIRNLLLVFYCTTALSVVKAQEICVHDDFGDFKNNIDANCRNLIISNIIFAHNGFRFQVVGDTPELDSFADYIARNNALYEVNFETLDKNWTESQKEQLEKNICEYIIYLVKGKDVRHLGLEAIEKELAP